MKTGSSKIDLITSLGWKLLTPEQANDALRKDGNKWKLEVRRVRLSDALILPVLGMFGKTGPRDRFTNDFDHRGRLLLQGCQKATRLSSAVSESTGLSVSMVTCFAERSSTTSSVGMLPKKPRQIQVEGYIPICRNPISTAVIQPPLKIVASKIRRMVSSMYAEGGLCFCFGYPHHIAQKARALHSCIFHGMFRHTRGPSISYRYEPRSLNRHIQPCSRRHDKCQTQC